MLVSPGSAHGRRNRIVNDNSVAGGTVEQRKRSADVHDVNRALPRQHSESFHTTASRADECSDGLSTMSGQMSSTRQLFAHKTKSIMPIPDTRPALLPDRPEAFTACSWWLVDREHEPPLTQGATALSNKFIEQYPGWDPKNVRRILKAYKQYLQLVVQTQDWRGAKLCPPKLVQRIWSIHRQDVVSYCQDCMLLCGVVVGNNPDDNERSSTTQQSQRKQRQDFTLQTLKEKYGSDYDEHIWNFHDDTATTDHGLVEGNADQQHRQASSGGNNSETGAQQMACDVAVKDGGGKQHTNRQQQLQQEEDTDDEDDDDDDEESKSSSLAYSIEAERRKRLAVYSLNICVSPGMEEDQRPRTWFKVRPYTKMKKVFENIPYAKFGVPQEKAQLFIRSRHNEGQIQQSQTMLDLQLQEGDIIDLVPQKDTHDGEEKWTGEHNKVDGEKHENDKRKASLASNDEKQQLPPTSMQQKHKAAQQSDSSVNSDNQQDVAVAGKVAGSRRQIDKTTADKMTDRADEVATHQLKPTKHVSEEEGGQKNGQAASRDRDKDQNIATNNGCNELGKGDSDVDVVAVVANNSEGAKGTDARELGQTESREKTKRSSLRLSGKADHTTKPESLVSNLEHAREYSRADTGETTKLNDQNVVVRRVKKAHPSKPQSQRQPTTTTTTTEIEKPPSLVDQVEDCSAMNNVADGGQVSATGAKDREEKAMKAFVKKNDSQSPKKGPKKASMKGPKERAQQEPGTNEPTHASKRAQQEPGRNELTKKASNKGPKTASKRGPKKRAQQEPGTNEPTHASKRAQQEHRRNEQTRASKRAQQAHGRNEPKRASKRMRKGSIDRYSPP
ncbi:expressed unknown protein [Seminavis robusta]|uniref:Ubiquitin-like domain-containing protein n=1 Tax=Seminavis robusta TaxID=568900 RepID=A0A9N8EX44_9STRA|nr:expressed unknown protein [Seminavis robusta]|eukprot:Sro2117_g315230.1 n/a (842) ;mRNA; r:4255-6780